jgi:chromate transporter
VREAARHRQRRRADGAAHRPRRQPRRLSDAPAAAARGSVLEVLGAFGRLGLTSFGGPVAHLGYFRTEFVENRRWIDERGYADVVALCQFLPGPASSQVGIALGLMRAGLTGALAAWIGFTLPSAIALVLFAYGVARLGDVANSAPLHGLKIVAVAVVAQAVWSMARSMASDRPRATLAVLAAALTLAVPSSLGQILAILAGGVIGWRLFPAETVVMAPPLHVPLRRRSGALLLVLFFLLLAGLPVLAAASGNHGAALVDAFYRSGALVFGGGHVVLPLLQAAVVPPGWIGDDAFLAGYGAAQAVPGPLFSFAAYLGASMGEPPSGWLGAALCLVAIYLPSFLLVIGVLPFWDALRRRRSAQAALSGINAAVVGLLLAALYTPVWTSAIRAPADFILAVAAFLLLAFWRVPPWAVVVLGALAAWGAAAVQLLPP